MPPTEDAYDPLREMTAGAATRNADQQTLAAVGEFYVDWRANDRPEVVRSSTQLFSVSRRVSRGIWML